MGPIYYFLEYFACRKIQMKSVEDLRQASIHSLHIWEVAGVLVPSIDIFGSLAY